MLNLTCTHLPLFHFTAFYAAAAKTHSFIFYLFSTLLFCTFMHLCLNAAHWLVGHRRWRWFFYLHRVLCISTLSRGMRWESGPGVAAKNKTSGDNVCSFVDLIDYFQNSEEMVKAGFSRFTSWRSCVHFTFASLWLCGLQAELDWEWKPNQALASLE